VGDLNLLRLSVAEEEGHGLLGEFLVVLGLVPLPAFVSFQEFGKTRLLGLLSLLELVWGGRRAPPVEEVLRVFHEEHAVGVDGNLALQSVDDLEVVRVIAESPHLPLVPSQEHHRGRGVLAGGLKPDEVVNIPGPSLLDGAGAVRIAGLGNNLVRDVPRILVLKKKKKKKKMPEFEQQGKRRRRRRKLTKTILKVTSSPMRLSAWER